MLDRFTELVVIVLRNAELCTVTFSNVHTSEFPGQNLKAVVDILFECCKKAVAWSPQPVTGMIIEIENHHYNYS
jgi:hypothetical protein